MIHAGNVGSAAYLSHKESIHVVDVGIKAPCLVQGSVKTMPSEANESGTEQKTVEIIAFIFPNHSISKL